MPPRAQKAAAASAADPAAPAASAKPASRRRSRAARSDSDDDDAEQQQEDSDEGEAEYDGGAAAAAAAAEKKRRSRGPEPREREAAAAAGAGRGSARLSGHAAAAAAAAAAAPVSSAAAAAAAAAASSEGLASMQALQRFFAVRGRASQKRVEQVWERIKQKCESPASKVIPLETAFHNLNLQLRFLELEVRKTKSEIDEQVYWVLVDQTERVAAANAKRSAAEAAAAAAAAMDDDEKAAAPAAAAASSASSGKKGAAATDAGEMAKFLNPSLFSEAQILYYKALLDAILASPNGQLSLSAALEERQNIVAEAAGSAAARRKLMLSPANAETTLATLCEQGWMRVLSAELAKFAASAAVPLGKKDAAKRRSDDSGDAIYALGERAYAELRKYIEAKAEGRPKCKLCGHACTMCLTCVQQSTASARASASNDLASNPCSIRLHYSCARSWFVDRKQSVCPDDKACGLEWDRYLAANAK